MYWLVLQLHISLLLYNMQQSFFPYWLPDHISEHQQWVDHPERSKSNGHRDPSIAAAGLLKQQQRYHNTEPEGMEKRASKEAP